MKARDTRWPSSWAFELRTRDARFLVRARNVSASGLAYDGRVAARPGQTVKFKIFDEIITGRVVRLSLSEGAITFRKKLTDRQLETARHYRDFHEI